MLQFTKHSSTFRVCDTNWARLFYPCWQSLANLKASLTRKSNSTVEFNIVSAKASELQERYLNFTAECEARSGLCSYLGIFQSIVHVIKQLFTADHDGNWLLHVAAL